MSVQPENPPGPSDRLPRRGIDSGHDGQRGTCRTAGSASSALIVVYSTRYQIDIGPHVFPTRKYSLVHARLLETGAIQPFECVEPHAASWNDLALIHTADYLNKMRDGTMSPEDTAQLELPWSPEMVEGFRLMTGGTIQAALIACGLTDEDRTQRP